MTDHGTNGDEQWRRDARREMHRSLVAFAQVALRGVILANGGAAIAILALVGHLAVSKEPSINAAALAPALIYFGIGVGAAVCSAAMAYISQTLFAEHESQLPGKIARVPAMLLVLGGIVVFFLGLLTAYDALVGAPLGTADSEAALTRQGTVTKVADGDTLTITEADGERYVIRLSDIDAPELDHGEGRPGQPFGDEAARSLEDLALGKEARAECYEVGYYGRDICHVFVGSVNVNLEQLERGWAMLAQRDEWIRDPESRTAEGRARQQGLGIWQADEPVPPWIWRRQCWREGYC